MKTVRSHIQGSSKKEQFANPFSEEFNYDKLRKKFDQTKNEDEENLIEFLNICNGLFKDIKRNVNAIFDKINLNPIELREFFFIAINKYHLDLTPQMVEQINTGVSYDAEKTTFSKFTNKLGQEVNAQLAIEIGGDILAELIKFSHQWEPKKKKFDTLFSLDEEELGGLFKALWVYTNILLNLKNSAYHIAIYENGKIIFRNQNEIKIENGLKANFLLKTVGELRSNNNTHEYFFRLIKVYEKAFEKRIGVDGFKINGNTLSPIKGKSNPSLKAKADSGLFIFYPHFTEIKLDFFDGLRLFDLLDLIVLLEECVGNLSKKNLNEYSERQLNEIPIKFNEIELASFLSEVTGIKISTINKFIDSLISNEHEPYFWREPLMRTGSFLYFPLAATVAPNHCLFFDKWTAISGYTLEIKEQMFKDFIVKEISVVEKLPYKFEIKELDLFKKKSRVFKNNILIETTALIILLEISLFDFPIESPEVNSALIRLGNGALNIIEKEKLIVENLGNKKEIVKILITNYTNFSGLQINEIPVADLTLFKNYVYTGNFRRVAVTFHEGSPVVSEGGVISYYNNEEEFNGNFKNFFLAPLPISQIVKRLNLKEQQITPDIVKPKFIIDNIDHLTDDEMMNSRMDNLSSLLNYDYFGEPENEVIKDLLDQSIMFSLSEIFSKLSYSPYESYKDRIKLYHNISKTKALGFAHLSFLILKTLAKLHGKKITKINYFDSVPYNPDEVLKILGKGKEISGQRRLSEFKIDEGTFTTDEEKQIISFSIDLLSSLTHKNFTEDILESVFLPLTLLHMFSTKHDVEYEFYSACGNIIDALNHIHKYQVARDFCEEILDLSIKSNKHSHGWNILFKCYTAQKSLFDASINGNLFLSSILVLPEIPGFLAVDSLYVTLKFFRNFGFTEYAKYVYENLQHFDLSEYDKQKITLSYFNSFFHGPIQEDINILDQVLNYIEDEIDSIIEFGEHGVIPWLALLYNIERLKSFKQIVYDRVINDVILKLENSIDKKSVHSIKTMILGDQENPKAYFISSLLNTYETRSVSDFVHESQHLALIASNLLQTAVVNQDMDGVLLAGLVLNDQSLTFQNIFIEKGSISPISKPINEDMKLRFDNYKYYLLNKINLKPKQLLVWIFEDLGKVYSLSISATKEIKLTDLKNWNFHKMKEWLSDINNFYFNAKKDIEGNSICKYSNPRAEKDYNEIVQREDYDNLLQALSFSNLSIYGNIDELFLYSSIEMSSFPHNLIEKESNFISASIPICNVLSLERFVDNHSPIYLTTGYSISAWIPTEDQETIISWGFNLLQPTLEQIKADIYTSTYPKKAITSDLNIFLAHGVTDSSGFKAIYTNHDQKKGIVFPLDVFGKGKIAVLFVCNSGSSKEAFFSNSIVSFSNELLKSGYEAVVAPFWPFDVTMSKIWLDEFISTFNQGYSINEAVWLANNKLSKYDIETSSMFCAPAGCLAMHLYGNPNIYVG